MLPTDVHEELFYRIALTFTPGIGSKIARILIQHFGSATALFNAPLKEVKKVDGIGETRTRGFRDAEVLLKAEKEVTFVLKNKIQALFPGGSYPKRLETCVDAPPVLYYRGNADLNAEKVVAVVGTRKNTDYGQKLVDELIDGMRSQEGMLVVSGLALGIDAAVHKKCVSVGQHNIGVLGHGLDRIYPATHKQLARQMVECGGVLTEFPSGTIPDRQNFPMRNRVVAGMSDVTIVVESQAGGGALITAHMAASYNREVAAYPGRVSDSRSAGCNELIRTNVAAMVTKADDVLELMNWVDKNKRKPVQRTLFVTLSPDEEKVVNALQAKDMVHADELMHTTGLIYSQLAATLLQLEMQGLVKTLPGKFYRMG